MGRQFAALGAVLVLVVLFFAVNILAGATLRTARLDLTSDGLYTLSPGARDILRGLDEPVTLTFYFSEKSSKGIPSFETYGRRIKEMLEEFSRQSRGKLVLRVVDPEPFSEAEDQATAAGLSAQRAPTGETLFLGLVGTNSTDGVEVIPFFDIREERFLEYHLARLVYTLDNPKKPIVGVISPLQITGGFTFNPQTGQPQPRQAWQVVRMLRELFEVRDLGAGTTTIPAEVDVLLVVHPKELSDPTLYAIDQYVLRGGNLIVATDPHCEQDVPAMARNQMEAMLAPKASSLKRLYDAWGVEMVEGMIVGDPKYAVRVTQGRAGESVPYVAYMQLDRGALSRDDVIAGQLSSVVFATSGALRVKEGRGEGRWATLTPIVQTSEEAGLFEQAKVAFMPDPKALLAEFVPGGARLTLAARISGMVRSAFPEGRPEGAEGDEAAEGAEHLAESKDSINVIAFADCDFLADGFWIREERLFGQIPFLSKFADNGDLAVNAVDAFAGSRELISLRARGEHARPFTRVQEILRRAEAENLAKERAVEDEIRQLEERLNALQRQAPERAQGGAIILSEEERRAIREAQEKILEKRKERRQIAFDTRRDVERLGMNLKIINIGLMPAVVALAALGLGAYRVSRRRVKVSE